MFRKRYKEKTAQNIVYEREFEKRNFWGSQNKILWVNNPQYYYELQNIKFDRRLLSHRHSVFISGCNKEFAEFFRNNKYDTFLMAKEAVLNLKKDHFKKASLKELIKSGIKKGKFEEIKFSAKNKELVEAFKKQCVHGKEPQLKYFFNDVFHPDTRLFVLSDKNNIWMGGILIADIGNGSISTDLLLRKMNAPRGVMEALIFSIFQTLKNEGYLKWSLGDVPFIIYNSRLFSREYLLNYTGRKLQFAYNYLGLYNFKNKFNPDWNDIYACCKSKMCFLTFLKVSSISNLLKLIYKKLKMKLL